MYSFGDHTLEKLLEKLKREDDWKMKGMGAFAWYEKSYTKELCLVQKGLGMKQYMELEVKKFEITHKVRTWFSH